MSNKTPHSCEHCRVVALRMGWVVPMPTQWEKVVSERLVSEKELDCVKATIADEPYLEAFFKHSDTSPYEGLL